MKPRIKAAHILGAALMCVLFSSASNAVAATVTRAAWGPAPSGQPVDLYTIRAGHAEVTITNYGARLVSIRVPDRTGKLSNVLISRDQANAFTGGLPAFFGATIGRYANRIAGAQFTLAGTTYPLSKNSGENTLHGGASGFNQKVWTGRIVKDGVEMSLVSPDGDMGFPGEVTVRVRFTLRESKGTAALSLAYEATTTKPTVINLTNHAFFNLADDPETPVTRDVATIAADAYTPVNAALIPTGALDPVSGTPFDLREPHIFESVMPPRGYDHNFVLRSPGIANLAAEVDDPVSGRTMRVYTTEPGIQLYLPHTPAGAAATPPATPPRIVVQAFCMETQHFPDSPNRPAFPTTVLEPGKTFHSRTIYVFGVAPMTAAQER